MSEKTKQYAKELVAKMSVEEKMSQMLYQSPAIERLGIPAYNWWNEALHGVARAGIATIFPQAIGMAATFDTELLKEIGDKVSTEGRAKFNEFSKRGDYGIYKGLTFWAPNINIFRDPRWGRGHETYGEDPYLTAELGISYIKGLQGEDPDNLKAAACAKHFAVHSGPEELRHEFDAVATKKDMYDTYLYAFKRCVKEAKVEAVMGAYNRVNGEPACGSKTLLQDILRDDWGFEGHVVSDCWAIKDFHENHHVTDTVEESVAMAVNNGCDLNCGSAYMYLGKAYEMGLVKEEAITQAVERLVEVRIRLGMMEDYPSPYKDIPYEKVECKEHIDLSLEASRRSMVLLKNKNSLLPLKKDDYKTVAVIGPNANSRDGLLGNYIGTSSEYITPLEAIKSYLGEDKKVLYSEGCHLYKDKVENLGEVKDRFAEAIIAAEKSDLVIMCLGLDATIEGEQGDAGNEYASGDKLGLNLPGIQQDLLETITKIGKPVVLVVLAGSALDLSWAQENVNSILYAWYPGPRGGKALVQNLFGEYSPNGKLPLTFYTGTENLPDFCDYSMDNRTYRYSKDNILYPFGYGLSYSDITYKDSVVSSLENDVLESVVISTKVTNNGQYKINESVQVYIKSLDDIQGAPGYQLKGIKAVELEKGETKEIEIKLSPRDFALITEEGKCVVYPGKYSISIGGQQPDKISEELTKRKTDKFIITKTGKQVEVEY